MAATPAILLSLQLTGGIRFGVRGMLMATAAAGLVVGGLIGAQRWLLQVITTADALIALTTWPVLLGVGALINGTLLSAGETRRRWEFRQWETAHTAQQVQLAAYRRERSGLSNREWTVLSLLAQEALTYEEIAQHLHISPGTVKTHVSRIGEKFGVHGRRAILDVARQRGLLRGDAPEGLQRLNLG